MLFFKECKKILFSLSFVIYLIAAMAMYFTQFDSDCKNAVEPPSAGLVDYGMKEKEIPEILMPTAIESLVGDYIEDSYIAYPIGFYKDVHLSENKKEKMAKIITEITGITKEELDSFENFQAEGYEIGSSGEVIHIEPNKPEISVLPEMTYERFRELMREADDIIGGGSDYSDGNIVRNFSCVPKTYEDAVEEYEKFFTDDKITRSYARLFCDYMGIVLAILPVFAAVSLTALDKRSHMEQLAYSRKISSAKLIFTRYAALVSVTSVPVVIAALIAYFKVKGMYSGEALDTTAFLRYSAIWLLPAIMTATAVGMFITELTSSILAIFVQGTLWFTSLFSSGDGLTGHIGKLTFLIRHSDLYELEAFTNTFDNFIFNRLFYMIISITIIALTVVVYELKRRGIFNGYTFSFKTAKNKS